MKALLLFRVLTLFAAVNLVVNFYAPNTVKLVLVPVFGLVFVVILGRTFRRSG